MNLIIDIGNSVAKLALFHQNELIDVFYDSNQSLDTLSTICSQYSIERSILSTVINLNNTILEQLKTLKCKLLQIDYQTVLPIKILYQTPQTLGSDRIAAVVGAQTLKPRKDILVIDAGTCLTYEFIDAQGNYYGGNIAPGKAMRLKALHSYTAKLPLI